MTRTGFLTAPLFLAHDTGSGHPERAERLAAIHEHIAKAGLVADLDHREAPPGERCLVDAVHDPDHVSRVEQAVIAGVERLDADTAINESSWDAALTAVGGARLAVDEIVAGRWKNAFLAARPPGHHAERDRSMGFCLFNTAVIAARHLQSAHGLERVAIVDWDVHHGNGTQHLTEDDPTIFYASQHQYPHYPGTGAADERGHGAGEGSVLNCPMGAGSGDREYLSVFESELLPALEAFDPEFVIVSAGFDAHLLDPLSSTMVTTEGFRRMSEGIVEVATSRCAGRLFSVLEGGYDLRGLAESVEVHLATLVTS